MGLDAVHEGFELLLKRLILFNADTDLLEVIFTLLKKLGGLGDLVE